MLEPTSANRPNRPHPCFSKHLVFALLAGAVVFGIAHTQSPLYFSNQHQYFVHGLAAGGEGFLDRDWLANTADPTPIFSGLVEFVYRHLHPFCFHVLFAALMGVYFVSLLAIAAHMIPAGPTRRRSLFGIGSLLIFIHAGIVRLASVQFLGVDYPWYFQSGVAGQYVLGPGLQPSAFGVFLVASVAAFAYDRLLPTIACSAAACLLHATYLLPAALLTFTYMLLLWRAGRIRAALLLGAGTLLAVLPVVAYSARTFAPTTAEIFLEAQRIVAEIRIPHHTMISRWFDPIASLQIAWIVSALFLVRRTKLFPLLAIPALLSFALSLVQLATGSDLLALLFPWRVSAVLIPLATAIVFTRLVQGRSSGRWTFIGWSAIAAISLIGGILVQTRDWGYRTNENELPALNYVRDHKRVGDLYLIPVRVPAVGSGQRGSVSTSFTSPPGAKEKHLIAVDLQRFRLYAGVPIYVDFKSIPYKDTDVLEWYRRLQQCQKWYASTDWNDLALRTQIHREGITHVLLPTNRAIDGNGYKLEYEDAYYRIYRLLPVE